MTTDDLMVIFSALLVFVTAIYVYLTKKTLDVAVNQSKLSSNPVIGIKIRDISVDKELDGYGTVLLDSNFKPLLCIELELFNIGNGPAIGITLRAEIELAYSEINGSKIIKSIDRPGYIPGYIPFIKSGESHYIEISNMPTFTSACTDKLLEDLRTQRNLLEKVKETERDKILDTKMRIYVNYQNNLDQSFESFYKVVINVLPKTDEAEPLHFTEILVPRPTFISYPINTKNKRSSRF